MKIEYVEETVKYKKIYNQIYILCTMYFVFVIVIVDI